MLDRFRPIFQYQREETSSAIRRQINARTVLHNPKAPIDKHLQAAYERMDAATSGLRVERQIVVFGREYRFFPQRILYDAKLVEKTPTELDGLRLNYAVRAIL